jgi:hypothetical protein
MYFIKYNENNKAILTHYQPFDAVNGLGKTVEELESEGLLVDNLPVRLPEQEGKVLILYVNPLRWEYEDRRLTQLEKLQKLVDVGTLTQDEMNNILGI